MNKGKIKNNENNVIKVLTFLLDIFTPEIEVSEKIEINIIWKIKMRLIQERYAAKFSIFFWTKISLLSKSIFW